MTTRVRVINWPDDFKDIKSIEDQMICGICYEFMETSVMTPCYHNYCSLCIRKYLHYKTECPVCFCNVFDKDLYINRNLDSIIQSFLQVREKIAFLVQNSIIPANSEVKIQSPIKTLSPQFEKSNILSSPEKRVFNKLSLHRTPHSAKDSSLVIKTPNPSDSPSTSHQLKLSSSFGSPNSSGPARQLAKIFNTPKLKRPEITVVADIEKVSCPVCAVEVPKTQINKHLDACLRREDSSNRPNKDKSRRPPLPKLVFRVMKEAELKKKLKEFGLSTTGDRKTLENRFTRYSTIYNAENDKINPRSTADLIKQCEQEEKLEKKIDGYLISAASTSTVQRLQVDRNAKEEIIEEAQKKYIEANKSSFDKLIEEVRNRNKNKIDVQETESVVKKEQFPSDDLSRSENQNDSVYNANTFVESDSDQSCVLQHYKSDDPVKFLSLNNICSSPSTSASNSPKKILNRPNLTDAKTKVGADSLSPVLNKKNGKKINLSKSFAKKNLSSMENEDLEESTKIRNEILKDFKVDDDSSTEFESSNDDINNSNVKEEICDDIVDTITETDFNNGQAGVLKSVKNKISNSEDDLDLEVSHIIEDGLPTNATFQNCKENNNPHKDLDLTVSTRSVSTRPQRNRTKTKRFGCESEDESETCPNNTIADGSLKRRRTCRAKNSESSMEENFQPRRRPYRKKRVNTPLSDI